MAFFCPAGLEWVPGCASGRIAGPDRDSLGSQGVVICPSSFFVAPWGCPQIMKFAYLKYFTSYMVKPCRNTSKPSFFFSRNLRNDGTSKRMMGGWGYWFVIEGRPCTQPTLSSHRGAVLEPGPGERHAEGRIDFSLGRHQCREDGSHKMGCWSHIGNETIAGFVFDTFYDEMWRYQIYCKLKRYIQI